MRVNRSYVDIFLVLLLLVLTISVTADADTRQGAEDGVGLGENMDRVSTTKHETELGPNENTFPELEGLDTQMQTFLRETHYSGATLGVAHDDRVLYTQGYGVTDEGAVIRPTTPQPISSLSKTITAVAVLKLVELGRLRLSDRVFGSDAVLSSFQPRGRWASTDPRLPDITVGHLLHHTAGWSQTRPRLLDPMLNSVYLSRGHDVVDIARELGLNGALTADDVICYMIGQRLDHVPGTKYEYSNFGYSVLGRVIEATTGVEYVSFVRSQILEPLGMWRTRIGPHRLSQNEYSNSLPVLRFAEGDIPISLAAKSTSTSNFFFDSTLGWWSTVYDMMRFVTGLASGIVLSPQTVRLLTKHPDAPVSEHRDSWHGLGVRTDEDSWWQIGDPHDNEILLFHQVSKKTSSKLGRIRKHDIPSRSWVVMLTDNNRKNLRQVFDRMMSGVTSWPVDNDLLIEDCGEFLASGGLGHTTLVNTKMAESHFPLLVNAVSRRHYYPSWIDAYTVNHKTYLAAIFKRDSGNPRRVVLGVSKADLETLRADNLPIGFHLNSLTSYNSYHHSGLIRYAAVFSQIPAKDTTFGIGETWTQLSSLLSERNSTPVTQSVASVNGVRQYTYSLRGSEDHDWKWFDSLTLDQLELQIRANAVVDRELWHLDSYVHLGEVLFSAILGPSNAGAWRVQTEVAHGELVQQSDSFRRLQFRPRIVVGYECDDQSRFVIMWKKH